MCASETSSGELVFPPAAGFAAKAHIDSIRIVLQTREKDPQSVTGKRVQRALEAVIRKLR